MSDWTLLTNHAHVLILLSRDPDLRMRDIAVEVGITERAVARIVQELTQEGYVQVEKHGRRNHYTVARHRPMRHRVERGATLGDLLHLVDHVDAETG